MKAPPKDAACTVRDIELEHPHAEVAGFVRVLDTYEGRGDDGRPACLRLLVLCDADPIVWRLRFEVVRIDEPRPRQTCLTGLSYVGRWPDAAAVVFMHPPTRAGDPPWTPGSEA